jgi:putative endonuclease
MNERQILGRTGEELALKYLLQLDYTLVCRNYRLRSGEIDLIMQDSATLVFIEVRSKTSTDFGTPLETIDFAKRRQIEKTARQFLARRRISDEIRCRFDVVGIVFRPGQTPQIEHIIDAFVAGE